MKAPIPLIAAALGMSLAAPPLFSGDPRAPVPIAGFVRQGAAWVPNEPLMPGRRRASGLQHPFPPMPGVRANPVTPAKAELGRLLFFDPILSGDNRTSCAHCHHPDFGLSDGRKFSMGTGGRGIGPERSGGVVLARGSPSLWNVGYDRWQFWDGRAETLEEQAASPLTDPDEMGESPESLVAELAAIAQYSSLFGRAFGGEGTESVTFDNTIAALATFQRTLLTFNSRFDRYAAGDRTALGTSERRGLALFRSLKTRCFECHTFPNFSDGSFRVIGVPDPGERDLGRGPLGEGAPDGAFKVPSLRNVALTAPYMHNGALETLEEVVDFYSKGGGHAHPDPSARLDAKIFEYEITEREKADLVAFLKALTDTSLQPEAPRQVPSGLPVVAVRSVPQSAPPPIALPHARSDRNLPSFGERAGQARERGPERPRIEGFAIRNFTRSGWRGGRQD